ncbi:MAG: cytochrome c3 family protein [Rhizobium sp.]|nr:cytochrome c3 family protein [Rhizobium sp.]
MKKASRWKAIRNLFRTGLTFSVIAAVIAVLANVGQFAEPQQLAQNDRDAWGAESRFALQDGLQRISPIALANACGLGASSCFKCHNGKRAAEPNMDEAKSPWHAQHRKANNSCVGCHKGNPRIMVKESAHTGLVKSARSGVELCGDCHKADYAKIEAAYTTK